MLSQFSGLLLLCCLAAPHPRLQDVAAIRPWEHESSDLPVDPRLHFGHFENGLRWVWARNSEPKFRSYLRLHVDVGSLAEEDSERGMAHFLEHMAFNGSEHFAADTLVEWFQRHGMAIGADLNAQTGFSETVYKLDLPNSDEQTIDDGLLVLRDFAFGLTISQEEIDKEKGVVDGEERERDSPEYRLFVRRLQALCGETRLDDRLPIGVREVRARFTAGAVRAFYRKWYRPENMTVILVGDFGELDPTSLFEKHFGAAPRPAQELPRQPAVGKVTKLAQRLCFHEPEIPNVSILIERLVPYVEEADDAARRRDEIPLAVARCILDQRFEQLLKEAGAPFRSAKVSAETLGVLAVQQLEVRCAPEEWREALAAGEQELRRALEHGFQAAELERAKALGGLSGAEERESTETSTVLVERLLTAAEKRTVPISAETWRALLEPVYRELTPERCHAALIQAWSQGELSLTTVGRLDLGTEPERALDEAWAASRAVKVEKGPEIEAAKFAYVPKLIDPLEVIAKGKGEKLEDLDFRMRFANGVVLNVKSTDFQAGEVLFRVELGEGRLSLPLDQQSLGLFADHVFEEGGLGAHTLDELHRILAGRSVEVSFSVEPDCFAFSGTTTQSDLLMQCAVVCAFLQDAAWREDGFLRMKRLLPLMYENLRHDHNGPVVTEFMSALYSGDERFAFPSREELEAVELPAVRVWLSPFLTNAPIEVSLVGDLELAGVLNDFSMTFGQLPARRARRSYDAHRSAPAPRSGIHQVHTVDTQVRKSLVLIAFPVPDGIEIESARHLRFLTEVLQDRLRVEVRERLGVAYSPMAGLQNEREFPGVGLLGVKAMAEPSAALELKEACLTVTDALARDGVTHEEVDRLREPLLEKLRDVRRENGWWLDILSQIARRPAILDEVRGEIAFFESLGAEPLTELAKTYLVRERASTVLVQPRSEAETRPAGEKKGD